MRVDVLRNSAERDRVIPKPQHALQVLRGLVRGHLGRPRGDAHARRAGRVSQASLLSRAGIGAASGFGLERVRLRARCTRRSAPNLARALAGRRMARQGRTCADRRSGAPNVSRVDVLVGSRRRGGRGQRRGSRRARPFAMYPPRPGPSRVPRSGSTKTPRRTGVPTIEDFKLPGLGAPVGRDPRSRSWGPTSRRARPRVRDRGTPARRP